MGLAILSVPGDCGMVWMRVVDEREASGRLRDARGNVSNIMRAQSLHPDTMKAQRGLRLLCRPP